MDPRPVVVFCDDTVYVLVECDEQAAWFERTDVFQSRLRFHRRIRLVDGNDGCDDDFDAVLLEKRVA